jgi:hypothetical protein
MVKEIKCFGGEIVLVDDEDYPLLLRHVWYMTGFKDRQYAATKLHHTDGKIRNICMHNMIIGIAANVDHKDNDTMNCQKDNLRPATRNENEWNKGKQKTARGKPCTSQYKGVSFDHRIGKYKAQIKRNGVHYDLGYHVNEIDAARAYNKKAEELSGKFLWLNPLPEINQHAKINT